MKRTNAVKTHIHAITGIQETIVRRLNRKLDVARRENKLLAILSQMSETEKDGLQIKTFGKNLQIENVNGEFWAVVFDRQTFKKKHWRKWRKTEIANVQTFSDTNFNDLMKQVKPFFSEAN